MNGYYNRLQCDSSESTQCSNSCNNSHNSSLRHTSNDNNENKSHWSSFANGVPFTDPLVTPLHTKTSYGVNPTQKLFTPFNTTTPSTIRPIPVYNSRPMCPSFPTSSSDNYLSYGLNSNDSIKGSKDLSKNCDFCKESKTEFKTLIDCLENMRKSNETFQKSVLNELNQLREVFTQMKFAFNEMPERLSDAFTHCFDSVRSISVDSEPEIVDILEKLEVLDTNDDNINDRKSEESDETGFSSESTQNESEINDKSYATKSSVTDRFIFVYDSNIDLNKWLKKD